MTIHLNPEFENGSARLAEDAGRPGDLWQAIELERSVIKCLDGRESERFFQLRIYVGDDDLSFGPISKGGLERLAAELAKLAEKPWEPD